MQDIFTTNLDMFSPLRIKVCGMRDRKNVGELCALGPDFIGYIFYPGSKRYVGDDPDMEIFRIPGEIITKVGVFVNEDADKILQKVEKFGLDMVQLHGSESPEYCMHLSEKGVSIIKAFSPLKADSTNQLGNYIEQIKYILFDNPTTTYGGSGRKFNWDLINSYSTPFPFLLSGGIGPEDGGAVRSIQHDWLYAVDINSRFESQPGIKNIEQVKGFIETIRK